MKMLEMLYLSAEDICKLVHLISEIQLRFTQNLAEQKTGDHQYIFYRIEISFQIKSRQFYRFLYPKTPSMITYVN
jgi:hypothetical protein